MKSEIIMYTDGSCHTSTGNGGCSTYIEQNGVYFFLGFGEKNSTNNRMELMAVIIGLRYFNTPQKIHVHSDSQYVIHGITKGWVETWKSNGWKTSAKKPVLNQELWEELSDLVKFHNVTFTWVKGHSTNIYNNFVDGIAGSIASDLTKYGF